MKKKLSGIIHVGKKRKNGKDGDLFFVCNDHTSYKIAKNHNWNRLKSLAWESVDAWGAVYFEFPQLNPEVNKVFYVKKFAVKNDDSLSYGDLDYETYVDFEDEALLEYVELARINSF